MPISASYLYVLLGAGMLFLEPLPYLPLSLPPSDSKPAGPQPDESTLPLPGGPSLPSSPPEGKTGTLVEEMAPPPHEQSAGPIPILPLQPLREEAAPMPHQQTPPTDVESLHGDTESLRLEREAMLAEEADLVTAKDFHAAKGAEVNLQKRIAELLVRVAQQTKKANETAAAAPPLVLPPPPAPTASITQPDEAPQVAGDAPVDPLALAQSLFRAGNFSEALDAYRKMDNNDLKYDERAAIQYMTACCLRKLSKVDEASALYRQVVNRPGNDFLSENAQWYLRTMKERRELEAQLEELRQRRQAMKSRNRS
jgi:pentatricopeptide repeat protein